MACHTPESCLEHFGPITLSGKSVQYRVLRQALCGLIGIQAPVFLPQALKRHCYDMLALPVNASQFV